MPLGTNHLTVTTQANFIAEKWVDNIITAYQQSLVLGNTVRKMPVENGVDTIHVPKPIRGSASAKAASTQVTLIANTEGVLNISVDKHYEYSRLFEDRILIQGLESQRPFYTSDAGYALSRQVDTDLHAMGATFNPDAGSVTTPAVAGTAYDSAVIGGDGVTAWDGSANTNTGNGTAITDAGIRRAVQTLENNAIPPDGNWHMVVPPVAKNVLLSIDRFNSSDFVGGMQNVRTGKFGEIYGLNVHMSPNCATVQADDSSTNYRAVLIYDRDAMVFAEQMSIKLETQRKLEYLGDLMTASTLYGVSGYQYEAGIALIVPA